MKQFLELNYANVFNHKAFMILLVFALKFINIQSFLNFKAIHESNNNYYIIKKDSINYYSNKNLTLVKIFEGEQEIRTIGESEISALQNIVLVKTFQIYLWLKIMFILCNQEITHVMLNLKCLVELEVKMKP